MLYHKFGKFSIVMSEFAKIFFTLALVFVNSASPILIKMIYNISEINEKEGNL